MCKLDRSLKELCIERCPKCGHWTPMIKGCAGVFSGEGFFRSKKGEDRYCMQCDTVFKFKTGLTEYQEK